MKKLIFLFLIGCIMTGLLFAGGQTESGGDGIESATIVLGHAGPGTDSNHLQQFSLKFKKLVEETTEGNVVIEIHPGGELGGERDLTEGVQLGTVDMTIISTGPLGNFTPISNVFDFPFLFRDSEHAKKVLYGPVGDKVAKAIDEAGIKLLAWGENGFRQMINNVHPIKTPKDLDGLKFRTMENKIHMASFQAWGADPTPMGTTELYTSLQQGVIDGMEGPLAWLVPANYIEVQKHMSISNHFYAPAPVMINKALFESFSPELQKTLVKAANDACDYQREFVAKTTEEFIQKAKDSGVQVVEAEDFDSQAFVEASQGVYADYQSEYGELIKEIRNTK